MVRIISPSNGPSNLVRSLVSLDISEANFSEILTLTSPQHQALVVIYHDTVNRNHGEVRTVQKVRQRNSSRIAKVQLVRYLSLIVEAEPLADWHFQIAHS